MKKKSVVLSLQLVLLLLAGNLLAGDHPQCQLCGMDLNKYKHVRYTVTTVDTQQITTCGVQCGLLLQLNLGSKFDSATATTLFEHRKIAAKDAWYVYKSSVVTDMSPGFIAFYSEDQARRFVVGFGGTVLNFQQAMDTVSGGFK